MPLNIEPKPDNRSPLQCHAFTEILQLQWNSYKACFRGKNIITTEYEFNMTLITALLADTDQCYIKVLALIVIE